MANDSASNVLSEIRESRCGLMSMVLGLEVYSKFGLIGVHLANLKASKCLGIRLERQKGTLDLRSRDTS